ncbi:MAG: hypothetical protein LUQ49_05050 [Methanomicrobiales archaeon]|nr:hypothetical protein [Methanomicrobiales archaeon]
MTSFTHGTLTLLLLSSIIFGLTLAAGCLNRPVYVMEGQPTSSPQTGTTATPVLPSPSPTPVVTTATQIQLYLPPETAHPTPRPSVDPIVGRWYAESPDDLTFEFFQDGTFIEESPNFATYHGTWSSSEEFLYDAFILDRWGYRKPAKLLYATGNLLTKGIGTMRRIG